MMDYCEVCNDDREYIVKQEEYISTVNDTKLKFIEDVAICSKCGAYMFIPKLMDKNVEAYSNKVKEILNDKNNRR